MTKSMTIGIVHPPGRLAKRDRISNRNQRLNGITREDGGGYSATSVDSPRCLGVPWSRRIQYD